MDGEVSGFAALAHLVTLLLHGPDIVGAAAGLDGTFGEEGGVGVGVTTGVGWWELVGWVVGGWGVWGCVWTFDDGADEEASCVDGVLEMHLGGFTGSRWFIDSIHAVGSLRPGEDRI